MWRSKSLHVKPEEKVVVVAMTIDWVRPESECCDLLCVCFVGETLAVEYSI